MIPDPGTYAVFAAAALALAVVPGPAVLYIVAQSVPGGRRAGIVSALGVSTGGLFHVCAAVIGLSALLAASAEAFTVVKLLGAAYLVYLGIRALLSVHLPLDFSPLSGPSATRFPRTTPSMGNFQPLSSEASRSWRS